MPPSSYSAMRSVFPSKFASAAAQRILPRSKLFAGAEYQSLGMNFSGVGSGDVPAGAGVVVSRSRSWIRRPSESVGSEMVTICVPVPLKEPTSGTPAAGVWASARCCSGVAAGMSQMREISSENPKDAMRRIERVNEPARRT